MGNFRCETIRELVYVLSNTYNENLTHKLRQTVDPPFPLASNKCVHEVLDQPFVP